MNTPVLESARFFLFDLHHQTSPDDSKAIVVADPCISLQSNAKKKGSTINIFKESSQ
jgi:hypothetical protein